MGVRHSALGVAAALVAAVAWMGPARAAPGEYHQDDRVGYKVRYPKGWAEMPLRPEERWIVAMFLCDRSYTWTDPSDGGTYDHKPEMKVIAFIAEVVKKRGVDVQQGEDGDFLVEISNPYKDYEDFLDKTYSGGGWYVASKEDGDLSGVKVTRYEIKVEKLAIPKRIVTWIFRTEDVDLAVQFEVLECQYEKLKGDVLACLKSFRLVPRTKGSLTPTTTEGTKTKPVDPATLTPEARTKQRQEQERTVHERAKAALPEGWTAKPMGRFLVLNHSDEKYAKRVVAHAEAVWSWLDREFAFLGEAEYVRRPILRICRDQDEENAFHSGTSWGSGLEIVTHEDKGSGAMSFEFEWVNRRLVDHWFGERAPGLMWALPYWADYGLHQVLGTARSKGKDLELKPDDWERDGLREALRAGGLTPVQALVMLTGDEYGAQQHRTKESAALIRFLLGSKKYQDVLQRYILAVNEVVVEREKARLAAKEKDKPDQADKPPETEEEEEARIRQERDEWKKREREVLQKAFDAAFPGWGEKDFKRLDAEYQKSL